MTERERRKFLAAPMVSKSVDDDDGTVTPRYRFTSAGMDEQGDIITRQATKQAVREWRQWRNIRLQHDASKPIGKAVRIGELDGLEWNLMDVRVDDPDVQPLVEGEDPVLGAASVGIIVNEFEVNEDPEAQERAAPFEPWIITDYDLVEISLVDHPANYDATRVPSLGRSRGRSQGRNRVLFRRREAGELSVRERLQRNQRATLDAAEEVSEKFDTLIEVFKARREAEREREEQATSELIDEATELALEKLRPEQPVGSEARVRKIIEQELMTERVKKLACRYHRG